MMNTKVNFHLSPLLPYDTNGECRLKEVDIVLREGCTGAEQISNAIHEYLEALKMCQVWFYAPLTHDLISKIADELGHALVQMGCTLDLSQPVSMLPYDGDEIL